MSWHYLRERGAAFSLPDYLDGIRSQQSRSKSTAARSSLLVRPRDISSASRSGTTSRPSTGDLFEDLLMSLPEDSPARTSVSLVVEWALPASVAVCGLSISDLLRRLGLDLYSPKTHRRSVPVALAPSYPDLPNWGMTYDGVCWELGTSARPIEETECGFLPTPAASSYGSNQGGSAGRVGKVRHSLESMAKNDLWPTPTAGDSKASGSRNTEQSKAHPGTSLTDAVRGDGGKGRMWPTPKSSKSGADLSRSERQGSGGDDLQTAVTREEFPTPTAQDHKGRGAGSYGRHAGLDNHVKNFPTPTAGGGGGTSRSGDRRNETPSLQGMARKGNWPTPGAQDAKWRDTPNTIVDRQAKGKQLGLHGAVILDEMGREQFPTPRASEWKGTGPLGSKSHEYRLEKGYLDATIQERGQTTGPLNPTWVEWLMGWPLGWTDLKQLATDRFHWWQRKHGLS